MGMKEQRNIDRCIRIFRFGKGTLMKELLTRYPDTYALSISATTRSPREG